MPTLIGAVEAIADSKLNLYALQATTGGPAVMIIINGPVRNQLNVNGGSNASAKAGGPTPPSVASCGW